MVRFFVSSAGIDVDPNKNCPCLKAVTLRYVVSVTLNQERYCTTVLFCNRGTAEDIVPRQKGFLSHQKPDFAPLSLEDMLGQKVNSQINNVTAEII